MRSAHLSSPTPHENGRARSMRCTHCDEPQQRRNWARAISGAQSFKAASRISTRSISVNKGCKPGVLIDSCRIKRSSGPCASENLAKRPLIGRSQTSSEVSLLYHTAKPAARVGREFVVMVQAAGVNGELFRRVPDDKISVAFWRDLSFSSCQASKSSRHSAHPPCNMFFTEATSSGLRPDYGE